MLSYTLSIKEYSVYLNDLPRYGLGIVFFWFGIDKFVIHEFYLTWFSATKRVSSILPFQDISSSIYAIGMIELIFAILLFTGLKIRWVCVAVIFFLLTILLTAQYPSSYPQDIGLVGIDAFLILANGVQKKTVTEKFLKFSWIIRISIAIVLFLWAADQMGNLDRHVGWFQLSSPLSGSLDANEANSFLVSISVVEIVLGVMIVLGKTPLTKYALVAVTIFFVFAIMSLEPPLNNHQTVAFVLSTASLAYIAFSKNKV